jgi:hypothetical protein
VVDSLNADLCYSGVPRICIFNVVQLGGSNPDDDQRGDSGGPIYIVNSDGHAVIRAMLIGTGGSKVYGEKWNTIANRFNVTIDT